MEHNNKQTSRTRVYRPQHNQPNQSNTSSTIRRKTYSAPVKRGSASYLKTEEPASQTTKLSHARKDFKTNNKKGPFRPDGSRPKRRLSVNKRPRKPRSTKPTTIRAPEDAGQLVSHIPPLKDGDIRIIPICGVEWVGTNMSAIEYKDEIIIIDAGFGFSNPDTPGISYTIPDIAYLEANISKIKALVITHGHLDHVGAIPYVIEKLGNPPIYTREFGAVFIQKRMEEFPHIPKLNVISVNKEDGYLPVSDNLKVKFFGLTHSIPDSSGVVIKTPIGCIVNTGDVRVESQNGVVPDYEYDQYSFLKQEKVLLLCMDSTGAIKPGWSLSEEVVKENINQIIKEATGRLFIAAFASHVDRMISFMESAKQYGKLIAIEGRSMKSNLAIVKHLELTDFSHVISTKEIDNYPPNKIVVLMTGAQGEEYAALNRMANETHPDLRLNQTDTIVLSASVVPGNDYSVARLKDNLYRGSYNVVTYQDNHVHASGHGAREELLWIHKQIPYKFFMPFHGEHNMLKVHASLIKKAGVSPENIIVPDNGSIIEIRDGGEKMIKLEEKAPARMIVVDGKMIGEIPDVVMRDRKVLGESGIFTVVVSINTRTGKLKKSPDLISRGFIYLREKQDLLQKTRNLVKKVAEQSTAPGNVDFDKLKVKITEAVEKHLFQETGKEPIVIPVVLAV